MWTNARPRKLALAGICILGTVAYAGASEAIKLGNRRIVGGVPTTIEKHPWQVALDVTFDDATFLCGGSIIAKTWVLSAAHCFSPDEPTAGVRVKTGATDYENEGQWLEVEKVIVHESYDPETSDNDIALVKLKRAPALGHVIPLASPSEFMDAGQPLEVTGWGATSEGGELAVQLLEASVPYVPNATCNEPQSYAGTVTPNMICAGHREGGVDSCQGDSGGPLVWRTRLGPILVGVVSHGEGCARQLKYGVYTNVAHYLAWIRNTMASQ